jgi:isopenicillin-N epimerase
LILSQIQPETKMLVLSHVTTGTGLVLPIAAIAEETRRAGIYLVIDGAHATGAISVDFRKLENVDFYGGNLHKWMLGPKGTGFGWVAPRNQEKLQPMQAGWTTFDTPEYYAGFGESSRFQGRFLLAGCHDFAPYFAIHETLDFWKKIGPQVIQNRIYELQRCAENEIQNVLKWKSISPPDGSLRGPLLSYELPESWRKAGAMKMFSLLREHQLQVAIFAVQEKLCLRLTPHIYNLESEIQRAVQILKFS